jgi:hypothetical protein
MLGIKKSPRSVAGFDVDMREFQNALETLFNVHYLLELEANNPDHVRQYLRLADPAMETLMLMSRARLGTADTA